LPKPFDPDELVAIVEIARTPRLKIKRGARTVKRLILLIANQIAQIKALLTQRNAIQTPASIKIDLTREQSVLNLVTGANEQRNRPSHKLVSATWKKRQSPV